MEKASYQYLGAEKICGDNTIIRLRKSNTYDRTLKITVKELFTYRKDILRSLDGETAAGIAGFLSGRAKVVISEPKYIYKYLLFLVALFIGSINCAHFLSSLYLYMGDWRVGVAVIPMTLSFVLNAVIAEVYGFRCARTVLWSSLCISFLTFFIQLSYIYLTESKGGYTDYLPLNTLGSLLAYFISDYCNNVMLVKFKNDNKSLVYRIFASNMFAHLVDSIFYIFISQFLILSFDKVLTLMYQMIIMKTFREILIVMPLIIILSNYLKKKECIDTKEQNTSMQLFSIDASYDINGSVFGK